MKTLISMLCLLLTHFLYGQDVQFTQFYTNSLYSNPAFAGSVHKPRIILHERVQWPGLDAQYLTSLISFDTYFPKWHTGLGIYAIHDIQGNSKIKSNEIQGLYSYEIVGLKNKWVMRLGGQFGFINRTLDYTNLIFPTQISQNGINASGTNNEKAQSKSLVDLSFGGLIFSNNLWFGYSMYHLNEPNQSFIGEESDLPQKQIFIVGYKFTQTQKTNNSKSYTPTLHYKTQGKSDQIDCGIYFTNSDYMLGLWYRGIPILKQYNNNQNNESCAFLFGYKFNFINISYTYDAIFSELTKASPYGAHEFNITVYPKSIPKSRQPMKRLPCPQF